MPNLRSNNSGYEVSPSSVVSLKLPSRWSGNFSYPQNVRRNAPFRAKYKTKDNRYLSKERMKNDGNDLVF